MSNDHDVKNWWGRPNVNTGDNALNIGGTLNILSGGTVVEAAGSINYSATKQQVAINTVLIAESNAAGGKIIIPGVVGKTITVLDFTCVVTGAYTTNTALLLEDSNGTPVVAGTLAQAQLTNGAVLQPGATGVTLGAGFGVPLTSGKGLVVANSGTAAAGGTSTKWIVSYTIA